MDGSWLLLGPILGCLLFGKAVDLGLKAGQDSLLIRCAGARAVDVALTVCRSFITGLPLVHTLGAQECAQRQQNAIISPAVCFYGDSEFNFWHHLSADMAAPMKKTALPSILSTAASMEGSATLGPQIWWST